MYLKRRAIVRTAGLSLLAAGSLVQGSTFSWIASASPATFNDITNWSPSGVPGATDRAVVFENGAFSISFTNSPTIDSAVVGSGVQVDLNESSGSQTWTCTNTIAMDQGGEIRMNGLDITTGSLAVRSNTRLTVNAGSKISATRMVVGSGSPGSLTVNNAGTISAPAGLDIGVNAAGSMNLSGGSSSLTAGNTSNWGSGSTGFATVTISGGATASFNSLNVGTNGAGASITLNGATMTLSGSTGLTIGSATGASTPTAQVVVTGSNAAVNVVISQTNILSRGLLKLTSGGHYTTSGNVFNVNGGVFDGVDGSYAFTASPLITISNNGSFTGNTFSTLGLSPNLQINSGGDFALSGQLTYSGGPLTVTGAGSTFQANSSTFLSSTVSVTSGGSASFGDTIVEPAFSGTTNITIGSASTARFGALSIDGNGSLSCSGTVNIGGALSNDVPIIMSGGSLAVAGATNNGAHVLMGTFSNGVLGDLDGTGSLELSDANVTANHIRQSFVGLSGQSHLASRPNGTNSGVSRVAALAIQHIVSQGTDHWDLTNNGLVIDYSGASPLLDIQGHIASGFNGGAWDGNGLISSTAAADHSKSLGYAENSALGLNNFMGQFVDATSILVRFTYLGDANLDATVDTVDFNLLATNFGLTGKRWDQGDFSYDGAVNTIDFNLLAANFGSMLSAQTLGASVPEPAGAFSIMTATAAAFARRRRR